MNDSKIKILPNYLVDQIKAGEVIENVATLLKEVIENSIDAGANKINLRLIDNGLSLISIEDNGEGIVGKELPLAFNRHATSKISKFNDLYGLNSFGFRGEALASMASISRITCSSTAKGATVGGRIQLEGGKIIEHIEIAPDSFSGTKIYIKDLFYNTPARLKFIKSKVSEKNAINKILGAFIVSNPSVEFIIQFDDADKVIFRVKKNVEERIKDWIGSKKKDIELIHLSSTYDGHKVVGFLTTGSKKVEGQNYVFVNNRYVQDNQFKFILKGISEKYSFAQKYGLILFLSVPEGKIDINVHPNKIFVKYASPNTVYSLFSSTVEKSFEDNFPVAPKEETRPFLPHNQMVDSQVFKDISSSDFFKGEGRNNNFSYFSKQIDSFEIKEIEEGKTVIIDHKKLTDSFLTDYFKKYYDNFPESEIQPLMIVDTVDLDQIEGNNEPDVLIKITKKFGFILEQLSNNKLAVRAIPAVLDSVNYIFLLKTLLNLHKEETQNLSSFLKELECSKIEKFPVLSSSIYQKSNFLNSSYVKELDVPTLQSLF